MKKYIINKNQLGFAHPILLVFLLISVIGVVGYTGQRVINQKNQTNNQTDLQSSQGLFTIETVEKENTENPNPSVSVSRVGSAADAPIKNTVFQNSQPASLPEALQISSKYDISTPLGSLSQLISSSKQKDYSSALYFVTPKLLQNAYNALETQNIQDFSINCQNNSACNTILSSNFEIDAGHITEGYCSVPSNSAYTECKKLSVKVKLEDGKIKTVYYKTVGYQIHEASINMLKGSNSSNWMIDQVTVDGITI